MTLLDVKFFSESLGMQTAATVILPQRASAAQIGVTGSRGGVPGDGWPTLYLLHGLSDDHTIWLRRTSIERYAAALGLAIVMPAVHRSWYTDMDRGGAYFTFVSEELPRLCRQWLRLSERREDTFIAGLSMGGYGAFKAALRHPERYAAAASLSGAVDFARYAEQTAEGLRGRELSAIVADPSAVRGSDDDLFALAARVGSGGGDVPALYACCGTGDFLYDDNVRFRDHAAAVGLPLHYEEHAGREHEWGYWDERIQDVLAWLTPRRG